jgi:hypothetical protein
MISQMMSPAKKKLEAGEYVRYLDVNDVIKPVGKNVYFGVVIESQPVENIFSFLDIKLLDHDAVLSLCVTYLTRVTEERYFAEKALLFLEESFKPMKTRR